MFSNTERGCNPTSVSNVIQKANAILKFCKEFHKKSHLNGKRMKRFTHNMIIIQ